MSTDPQVRSRASQVTAGVFLIGLALLFLLNISIWPAMMFVLAIALLASEYFDDNRFDPNSQRVRSAVVVAIIGAVFLIDFDWGTLWPLILIAAGAYMLFGDRLRLRQ